MNSIKKKIITLMSKMPYVKGLKAEVDWYNYNSCFAPGHFYSPICNRNDILNNKEKIWQKITPDKIAGINLRTELQIKLITQFEKHYKLIPFTENKSGSNRYYYNNGSYSYTDAILLFCFIKEFTPKKIIEVGSGFSSAAMLDTKDVLSTELGITFIEPYPALLKKVISGKDFNSNRLIEAKVQTINLDLFKELSENDILFIDSTHVSKTGSEVNFLFHEVLPVLEKGVIIHFHDIFYPFEYPFEWVIEGRNWNELYFLRNFLMYNNDFNILFFSHYLHLKHSSVFKNMPLCYKNLGGNLWLQKQ